MTNSFERDDVRFAYPKSWQFEVEEGEEGWTASVQSDGTAFVVVSYYPDVDDPAELADAALEGLREYPNLEVDETIVTLAGRPAIGADVSFVHFDLPNTCWIRAVQAGMGSLLVMSQCCDIEMDGFEPELTAILASVVVNDD